MCIALAFVLLMIKRLTRIVRSINTHASLATTWKAIKTGDLGGGLSDPKAMNCATRQKVVELRDELDPDRLRTRY